MLGRILKNSSHSSSSSSSASAAASSAFPQFKSGATTHNPFPVNPPKRGNGRRLDITFSERYMQGAPQLPVVASLWRMKQKNNIRKAEYRRLPMEEKQRLYLESRPMKQKLLDWVGSKTRALVRSAGTVDAWAGPSVRNTPYARIGGNEVKLLGSGNGGYLHAGISERAKRIIAVGLVMSMGGLMAWLFVEKTRLEGPESVPEPELEPKGKKTIPLIPEEKEKRPGVFVWGSNRYFSHCMPLTLGAM